jgi:hypothetical protein
MLPSGIILRIFLKNIPFIVSYLKECVENEDEEDDEW